MRPKLAWPALVAMAVLGVWLPVSLLFGGLPLMTTSEIDEGRQGEDDLPLRAADSHKVPGTDYIEPNWALFLSTGALKMVDADARRKFLVSFDNASCPNWPKPKLASPCGNAEDEWCMGNEAPIVESDSPRHFVSVPVRMEGSRLMWLPYLLRVVNRDFSASSPLQHSLISAAVLAARFIVENAVKQGGGHSCFFLIFSAGEAPVPVALKPDASLVSVSGWLEPSPACCLLEPLANMTWGNAIAKIASTCAKLDAGRRFFLQGEPHFSGGREQLMRALLNRGWSRTHVISQATIYLGGCLAPITWDGLSGVVISRIPGENSVLSKKALLRAVRRRSLSLGCDYTKLVPESFIVADKAECLVFMKAAQQEKTTWFLKSSMDSFGRGVAVVNSSEAIRAVRGCKGSPPTFFVQRGVTSIQFDGRRTQGRAYLIVSSMQPISVWFFDGYFNVAAADAKNGSKEALVTNMGTNQRSRRFPSLKLFERLKFTVQGTAAVRSRIKEAFLAAFLSIPLTRRSRSFSLWGLDYIVDINLGVRILEVNCNCELFADEKRFGKERVDISSSLTRSIMDVVLASNLAQTPFADLLRSRRNSGSFPFVHGEAELLYSEAINPPWTFAPLAKCYPSG